jgi:hypothetical protein
MLVTMNTRQTMRVECNSEVTYSKSVFAALVIQHAKRKRRVVIFALPGCTIFFHTA